MLDKLRHFLRDGRVNAVGVDSDDLLAVHSRIVAEKRLLQSAFSSFYSQMARACDEYFRVDGFELELGSGAGFFKKTRPEVITSDVRHHPGIERVIDAQNMDMPDESLRCVYGINVFHHLHEPRLFFEELARTLKPGGGALLIEPHNGPFSGFLCRRIHKDEYYDPDAQSWETEASGPMSNANQALSYIVFERDREKFARLYGDRLQIAGFEYNLNGLRYLLSGGVNFRSFAPAFMDRPLAALEKSLAPLAKYWTLSRMIVLKKP